jgi:2-polyprenyl-3-methyl-5-hydroxy-6-metoxy-1,4-benzoquinol methylase
MRASGLKTMIQNRWNRHEVYCKADYWDAKADEYGGTAVSGWPNQSLNVFYDKRELEILNSYLPQIDGAQVLDLGCGTGRIARYLAARNANVLGIDFSAKAIEVAKQQSPSANPAYRVQTIFELKEDKQFDIALSFGCLAVACTNRDTLSTALTNVFNSLKPGGRILLLEPIHRGSLHFVLNMNVREFFRGHGRSRIRSQGRHCTALLANSAHTGTRQLAENYHRSRLPARRMDAHVIKRHVLRGL